MILKSKFNRGFIISTIMIITIIFLYSTPSFAALLSWDLVDSGKHMDVDGNSTYMSYVWSGKTTWNNYKSGVIRQDSASVVQDVYCSDINKNNSIWGTTYKSGTIEFNKYNMSKSSATDADRKHTATHELGHGLGIDHDTSNSSTLMYNTHNKTYTLGTYEKNNYDAAYKKYK